MTLVKGSSNSIKQRVYVSTVVSSLHTTTSRLALVPNTLVNQKRVTLAQIVIATYHWLTWLLATCLVLSQFLTIFWDTIVTTERKTYGQSPLLGTYAIPGMNDEPYSDRCIVCVQQGRTFEPLTVNEALDLGSTKIVDTTGAAQSGYRLVNRTGLVLSTDAYNSYANTCSQIAITLDTILSTCALLGYNVTQRSGLNIVNGDLHSTTTFHLPRALPIVIMPYWDNCLDARSAVPGVDGSACMIRLIGKYVNSQLPSLLLDAVNRTVRETRTVDWLNAPGGTWRNGWYEDRSGSKWYSDVTSSNPDSTYRILRQRFDMHTGDEVDCSDRSKCVSKPNLGSDTAFRASTTQLSMSSITIGNGKRFGLFLYEGVNRAAVTSTYDWQTLLSNVVVGRMLLLWLFAQFALARAYVSGVSDWHSAGVGCLANAQAFGAFPYMLLPRLRRVLLAFWTIGCEFEGTQYHFAKAWFVIYPSIVEFMFFYYGLLNAIAKLSGRRVSDVLFGMSMAALCLLHWRRQDIATVRYFGFSGRISSLLTQDQINGLSMADLLTPRTALRVNGDAEVIFYTKIAVLALNLVPLLCSVASSSCRCKSSLSSTAPEGVKLVSDVERTLAVRLACSGGFGRLARPSKPIGDGAIGVVEVDSYELVRLGYIVFGDKYVITLADWELVTLVAPLRAATDMWHHRVLAFSLERDESGVVVLSASPTFFRIDASDLQQIRSWDIRSRAIA